MARIARCFCSTTGDVTSMYARRDGSEIHYRVVDEYGGDTLTGDTERTSAEPLTLGELTDFFLNAWNLFEVLEFNEFANLNAALTFFDGRSEFYPDFDRYALLSMRRCGPASTSVCWRSGG